MHGVGVGTKVDDSAVIPVCFPPGGVDVDWIISETKSLEVGLTGIHDDQVCFAFDFNCPEFTGCG